MKKDILFFPLFILFVVIVLCLGMNSCKGSDKITDENSKNGNKSTVTEDTLVKNKKLIDIDSTYNLIIYKPNYSKVELACINRPSKANDSIIMMIGAAFTGAKLEKFDHSNICGSHTSKGVFYKNAPNPRYTGTFTFVNGIPQFYYKEDYDKILENVALNGGCGFIQDMIIHSDTIVPQTRNLTRVEQYRALSLLNNELVVIDSNRPIKYELFLSALKSLAVKEAIYTDMGDGWNYSWYRDNDGNVVELHPGPYKYSSNWITFYK